MRTIRVWWPGNGSASPYTHSANRWDSMRGVLRSYHFLPEGSGINGILQHVYKDGDYFVFILDVEDED